MTDIFVTIGNFAFGPDPVSEAEFARIKLEAEGIPCFLSGRNFTAIYWLWSGANHGVKLQVKESDAKRALEILGTREEVNVEETDELASEPGSPRCPKCNCDDIEYEKFSKKTFYLSILFLNFPLPFLKRGYRCNNCGHTWK